MGIDFLMKIIKIIFEGNLRDIGYLTKLPDRIDFKGLSVFRKKTVLIKLKDKVIQETL